MAVPWYVLCAARNPEFLRIFFLEHNIERFLTNRYQHQQPFWFFVPILLIAVFPWTLLLIPALAEGWRALRGTDWRKSPSVFLAAWVIFPFVFFSASQSKLPGYILPTVPPLILLLARAVAGDAEPAASPARRRVLWAALSLTAAGIVAVFLLVPLQMFQRSPALPPRPDVNKVIVLLALTLLAGGIVAGGVSLLRSLRRSAAAAALVFAFAVGIAANHLLPLMGPSISPRQVASAARDRAAGAHVAVYELPRAWQYGSEFYLDRALLEWNLTMPRPVWVITSEHGFHELERAGVSVAPAKVLTGRGILLRVE